MTRRRRMAVATALVMGLMLWSTFLTPTRGSVMAGLQQVVTPVTHAQYFNGLLCDQAFQMIDEWEFQGWGHVSLSYSRYLGTIFYGYDVYEYGGTWYEPGQTPVPFSFQCLQSWF